MRLPLLVGLGAQAVRHLEEGRRGGLSSHLALAPRLSHIVKPWEILTLLRRAIAFALHTLNRITWMILGTPEGGRPDLKKKKKRLCAWLAV